MGGGWKTVTLGDFPYRRTRRRRRKIFWLVKRKLPNNKENCGSLNEPIQGENGKSKGVERSVGRRRIVDRTLCLSRLLFLFHGAVSSVRGSASWALHPPPAASRPVRPVQGRYVSCVHHGRRRTRPVTKTISPHRLLWYRYR